MAGGYNWLPMVIQVVICGDWNVGGAWVHEQASLCLTSAEEWSCETALKQ
jgi:hypothetical protein